MSFQLEFECSGFQLAEFHVPPFELFTHQLAFVRWPGKSDDPMFPQFLRILSGLDPHPAVGLRRPAGIALPLGSLVFPERRFPRKGSFISWVKRELADNPAQVNRVLHGLPDELNTRPMESTGNGPFYVISLRIELARNGMVLFKTAGTDPSHAELARASVMNVSRDQVEGCGIEVLTSGMKLDDSECPDSVRVFVTRFGVGDLPR